MDEYKKVSNHLDPESLKTAFGFGKILSSTIEDIKKNKEILIDKDIDYRTAVCEQCGITFQFPSILIKRIVNPHTHMATYWVECPKCNNHVAVALLQEGSLLDRLKTDDEYDELDDN